MIKHLAFAATGAAIIFLGLAAKSDTIEDGKALTAALHRAGVETVSNEGTGNCANPRLYGQYDPRAKRLTLCINNIPSVPFLHLTYRHEAAHAIQHCVGGLVAPNLADDYEGRFVKLPSGYPAHQKWHEVEARDMASLFTTVEMAKLVDTHCNR